MKTLYRIAFWADEERKDLVESLTHYGITVKANEFEVVEFYEDHIHINALKSLFEEYNLNLTKSSVYSELDLISSPYLGLLPSWHHGYPQPEDDYEELCYNLHYNCEKCGIGKRQIKPLRFKGEPKWGRRQIMQLNWIFDEYFCTPDLYKSLFESLGIGFWPVVKNNDNSILTSVIQLDIPMCESELIMNDYPFEICDICYKKKYLPIVLGGYPKLINGTSLPIYKSKEYFGSGASAWRQVSIQNDLYRDLLRRNVKGVSFAPVFDMAD